MKKLYLQLFVCFILVQVTFPLSAQFYDGTHTPFGKNRVQYDEFEWQFYRFKKFEVYFYTGGKELAVHSAKYLNKRIAELEKKLDYYLEDKIQLIIYNKHSHFQQSNIGLSTNEMYNIGGVTQLVDNKLFVYFEGDYAKFNEQIDKGISRVLIYQMMYGGNWREVLKNSTLLRLPDWYVEGFLSYISDRDNPIINSRIKDGVNAGLFDKFNRLQGEEAVIAGHAMWKYIADTYGENVFSNIFYMTRITRSVDDGFLFVLGVSFKQFSKDWITYYQNLNLKKDPDLTRTAEAVDVKINKNRVYGNFVVSAQGNLVAYSSNHLGQNRIYVYDLKTKKRKKIYKNGHKLDRITDFSYPILDWHPSGEILSFITEEKGELLLYFYDVEDDEISIQPVFNLEKVLSFDYSPDGRSIVFSGVFEGQSDLYSYNVIGNTQKKLTNDQFDDLQPSYINNSQIAFVSNRTNTNPHPSEELKDLPHQKDIFLFDLKESTIVQVTETPNFSESFPMDYNNDISYLAPDNNNIQNRYIAKFDSSISSIDTIIHYDFFYKTELLNSYDRSIMEQRSNPNSDFFTEVIYKNRKHQLILNNYKDSKEVHTSNKNDVEPQYDKADGVNPIILKSNPKHSEKDRINFNEYKFYNEEGETKAQTKAIEGEKDVEEEEELKFPTQRLYRLNFKPDNSVLQLNNTFLNRQYQNFNGGPYINAGVGASFKIGIVDLMEDYRVYGGFRYSYDLIEYSISFQDLSKRVDKEYSFARTRQRFLNTSIPYDVKTLTASYSLIYPFSEVSSLRVNFSGRNDKIIPLSSDLTTLRNLEINNEYWANAKVEYVFDNTRNVALNIRYGLRFKLFAEHFRKVYSEIESQKGGDLSVLGFDFRHYQKIHREIIWVNRFAGSSSFGNDKLIYYLGGVDDWTRSDIFNFDTDIDYSQNYRYQALAANMRGFLQNIRNGTSFSVINSELRLPIFSYFVQRPIQSDFVRNFQIVGFGDLGTAWVGSNPYSSENTSNHRVITTGPITVRLEDVNDPIVGGMGFGLRTTLLGYFVRADWAWGIQNGQVNKDHIFYLSLSLDI